MHRCICICMKDSQILPHVCKCILAYMYVYRCVCVTVYKYILAYILNESTGQVGNRRLVMHRYRICPA